jgi:hypothetical protein
MTIPSYFRNIPTQLPTASASDFQAGYEPANVLDGKLDTFWHSEYTPSLIPLPHSITVDLSAVYAVSAVKYTSRQDGGVNGRVGQHSIELSTDGSSWTTVRSGSTWPDVSTPETDSFNPTNGRYVRLSCLSEAGGRGPWSSAAEITTSYVGNSTESAVDIDFSAPWISKYVEIANVGGVFDQRGLVMDGQAHKNSANWDWTKQLPVPDYGHCISVFALDIPAAYYFPPPRGPPLIANISFAGWSFNPNTGKWVDWSGDDLTDLANADLIVGNNASTSNNPPGQGTTTNIVYCIQGKECSTIFANGRFQLTLTKRGNGRPLTAISVPELFSWWTDIIWRKMRVWPALTAPP